MGKIQPLHIHHVIIGRNPRGELWAVVDEGTTHNNLTAFYRDANSKLLELFEARQVALLTMALTLQNDEWWRDLQTRKSISIAYLPNQKQKGSTKHGKATPTSAPRR